MKNVRYVGMLLGLFSFYEENFVITRITAYMQFKISTCSTVENVLVFRISVNRKNANSKGNIFERFVFISKSPFRFHYINIVQLR